jgi:alpha-L-rhamnosidase
MHNKRISFAVRILIASGLVSLSLTSYSGIENMMIEYTKTPLGIDVTAPRFGWQMTAPAGERHQSVTGL